MVAVLKHLQNSTRNLVKLFWGNLCFARTAISIAALQVSLVPAMLEVGVTILSEHSQQNRIRGKPPTLTVRQPCGLQDFPSLVGKISLLRKKASYLQVLSFTFEVFFLFSFGQHFQSSLVLQFSFVACGFGRLVDLHSRELKFCYKTYGRRLLLLSSAVRPRSKTFHK